MTLKGVSEVRVFVGQVGQKQMALIGTPPEGKSSGVTLMKLPHGHPANAVREAVTERIAIFAGGSKPQSHGSRIPEYRRVDW
jgi:hypothetical protein